VVRANQGRVATLGRAMVAIGSVKDCARMSRNGQLGAAFGFGAALAHARSVFMRNLGIAAVLAGSLLAPSTADAFCGFYINGAGSDMFNNATQVVLMRNGTRTVLSMQNNYQGPPSDFAMVVPVPVVLQEADVKTLSKAVFDKVDVMGAPRLVEYWEQDPCRKEEDYMVMESAPMPGAMPVDMADAEGGDYGVTIEAKFAVGEYDIVILSAKESTGLDRFLRDQKYQIPKGAEPLLRPYVEGGSKFFVAKVDPKKVRFENGQAMLSPLRFHYDSEEFALPIRLGLANAKDKQDLIVSILSPGQRYEVANYKNVTIPTNLDVHDEVRTRFGEFYAALFDRTIEQNPGAVVTEYAWDASTCDPCPGPQLDHGDFLTLGADVLGADYGFVLTRLHARYGKEGVPDDLLFKKAQPIVGGREIRDGKGKLEERARPDSINNFQGRYAIRHPWTGPIECKNPQRGIWGGPPDGSQIAGDVKPATNTAFAPRGQARLPALVAQDVPEIAVKADRIPGGAAFASRPQGCGCESGAGGIAGGAVLVGMVLVFARRRRTP
jgi:MYXO-CTERM domain-containing protein